MIAIGGSIGTGLFLASGASVATAGPGATINWSGLAAPVLIASVSSIKRCGGNCG
jgi:lysine-specific permease